MKFTDLFIRRPVLALVINFLILLAGYQSLRTLNVRQYPRSDLSVVAVTTVYVGANADLVRGFITTPLERVIASAEGIDYMESNSAQGLSTISVHLKLNYDTNAALTQIQAKIAQVRNDLPPEAEAPVINVQTTDDQIAAMYLSFYSDSLEANQITDYLTRVVQPKLTSINGVQRADILGARTFAMRIWMKPDRMASLNVSPSDVRNALAANNYLSAVGATKGSMISVNLIANTDLRSAPEFENLVVRQNGNTIIRLRDVANVVLGAEDYTSDVRFDGSGATFMGVWVLPTSNTLDVIHAARKMVPEIEKSLPTGMHVGVPYDSTKYIEDAIDEVVHTLIETLLIVVAVIFLFLGNFRSVLIPVVAIPISLIGAAFLMLAFGFTLNLLTLLAIVLAVGLVVDDAIVVVENVERHMHAGESPLMAATHAARELVGPIIAMTITLAAVYAPIGIQGGLTGALFREFAFTLAGAVIVSGVVALTLSPMMASRLLRAGDDERGFSGWLNRRFDNVRNAYTRLLLGTMDFKAVTLTLAVLIIPLLFVFYTLSGKELAPKEDQGIIFGIVQAGANSTLDQTTLYTRKFRDVLSGFPEKDHVFQITFPSGDSAGFSGMVAKPWSERHRSMQEILPIMTKQAAEVPGIGAIVTTPQPLPGGSNFDIEFVIASTGDPRQLLEYAKQLQAKLMASQLSPFSLLDLKYDQPQATVVFDRDKVASLGLNLSQVGADLSTMLGGKLRQPLHDGRALVQGDSGGDAHRAAQSRAAFLLLCLRPEGCGGQPAARAAEHLRHDQDDGRAAPVEPFPAVEFGQDFRRADATAGRDARCGAQGARNRGRDHPAQGLRGGLRRGGASTPAGGQQVRAAAPDVAGADLPGAGGAVRELQRSVHHPARQRAAGTDGGAHLFVPGPDDAQYLCQRRVGDAGGAGFQERHPDRGVRQQAPGGRLHEIRGGGASRRDAPAADPDDERGDGGGTFPVDPGERPGGRGAQLDRLGAGQRHDHRDGFHAVRAAVDLPGVRTRPQPHARKHRLQRRLAG